MKPIEKGCIAILTKSQYPNDPDVGKAFTIGAPEYGDDDPCIHCKLPGVDWPLLESDDWWACSCTLIRIDGHEVEEVGVEEVVG